MYKTTLTQKRIFLSSVLIVSLTACNSGSNNNGGTKKPDTGSDTLNPPMRNLVLPMLAVKKNIFDSDSIKNLVLSTKTLTDTNLKAVDLNKIGSYANYKILISNPNEFSLKIHGLRFGDGNYYFAKNNNPDNCFNQKWYHADQKNGSYLDVPAKTSCALYTTSSWHEYFKNVQSEYLDHISYIADGESFGYTIDGTTRKDMWCKASCSPIGERSNYTLTATGNDIHFKLTPLKPSDDARINNIPDNGIILSGKYLISGAVESLMLRFKKYSVAFESGQSTLSITATENIPVTGIVTLKNFTIAKDGLTGMANVDYSGSPGIQNLQLAFSLDHPYHDQPAENIFFPYGIQGADGQLYLTANYYLQNTTEAFLEKPDLSLISLRSMIKGLPRSGSITILGADAENNLVLQTNNNPNGICYRAKSQDLKPSESVNMTTIKNSQIISSKSLYINNPGSTYYNFDLVQQDNIPFYSRVDTQNCNISGLRLAMPNKLIITDRFAAIKTSKGYAFVNPEQIVDGSTDIR